MKNRNKTPVDRVQPKLFIIVLLYILFLVIQAIPAVSGIPGLWGVDQWQYFSGPAVFILFVAGLLPVVPAFRSALVETAGRVGSAKIAGRVKAHPSIFYPLLLIAAAVVFRAFRQATHFLGDGYLWINHIEIGYLYRYWELVVPCWLYRRISGLINAGWLPFSLDTRTVAVIISIASGLVFLFFAYKTARCLSDKAKEQFFLLLAVLSTGTMLLFFGYIEAYPPAAAAVMAYMYYGLRCLKRRGGVKIVTLVFLLSILLHPSLAALLPSLLLLYWFSSGRSLSGRKYYATISAVIAAGFVFLWIAQERRMFSGYFYDSFLPFLESSQRNRVPYNLFSPGNLFDLFNELLLICPVCVFTAVIFIRRGGKKGGPDNRIGLFLGTAVIFYILEFFAANKLIGASRDWDIFSPMAVPLALYTSILILERFRRVAGVLSVFIFFIMALHTVPWIAINASREASLSRFANLVNDGGWSNYARGYAYDELGAYFLDHGETEKALEFSVAATGADPGNVRYLYNAATMFMRSDRYPEAVRFYRDVLLRKPDYLQARFNLGTLYMEMGKPESAGEEFLEAIRIDSTFVPAYNKLASVYRKRDRVGEAEALYMKSIELAPGDPRAYHDLALLYLDSEGGERAKKLLMKSMEVDSGFYGACYSLGKIYLKEGDLRRAADLFDKCVDLRPSDLDARFDLAVALDGLGRLDEALYQLLHVLDRRRNDMRVMNNIGVIYSRQGKFRDAVRIFERALRLNPKQAVIHVNLARAYYRLGEYGLSWKSVIEAESMDAAVPADLLANLGRAMKRPGR